MDTRIRKQEHWIPVLMQEQQSEVPAETFAGKEAARVKRTLTMESQKGISAAMMRGSCRGTLSVLEAEQEHIMAVFDAAPAGMMLIGEGLEVLRVNKMMRQHFMLKFHPLYDKRCGAVLRCANALIHALGCGSSPSCDSCALRRTLLDTIDTGTSGSGESCVRIAGADGSVHSTWVQYGVEPLLIAGRRLALLSLVDVTERKQLEERYFHSQKMESLGRLAGGMAHDFNNLLTVILAFGTRLLDSGSDPAVVRMAAERIIASCDKAATLTRQLLAFSRKEVRKPVPIDVSTAVAAIEPMLRRLVGEDVDLMTDCQENPGCIYCDMGQLEQIIMNLVVNARDAMPSGGVLAIATRTVKLGEAGIREMGKHLTPGFYVMLEVRDTGIGMDRETLSHLFEPFFTTKEPGKGTGLGLATVHAIVKQTGGDICVSSEPGKGSIFRIYLPLHDEECVAADPKQDLAAIKSGNGCILLVEDDDGIRALTADFLGECGYSVISAASGEEALKISTDYDDRIHLVITDVVMTGMDGYSLMQGIMGQRPEVKGLFMSGYTEHSVMQNRAEDARTTFLQKPFTMNTLADKVFELLK